ncbi:hypothetical protein [Telluribacter sp. SYSU D00476]|uniref:hypothetical protein n=1 Tax=Telluribacter sp. SYSU D00476 TaxID=2811430 RepID=UPI001FF664B6|nr:hypothetical protein [Telluribacter sp. SYSU D00476]
MATFISCPGQNQAVNLDSVDTITLIDTNNHQYCIEFYKKIMVQIPTQVASWSFESRRERDAVYQQLKAKHFSELIADTLPDTRFIKPGDITKSNGSNGNYNSESN